MKWDWLASIGTDRNAYAVEIPHVFVRQKGGAILARIITTWIRSFKLAFLARSGVFNAVPWI